MKYNLYQKNKNIYRYDDSDICQYKEQYSFEHVRISINIVLYGMMIVMYFASR